MVAAAGLLAGCATRGPSGEEPPRRDQYLKVKLAPYAGAGVVAGAPPETARGTRYRSGAISSAAADWSRFPAGTTFRVLTTRELFEVDDYTDDIVGTNTILLFKPKSPNVAAGVPHELTIEIVRWGSPKDSAILLQSHKSSTGKRILKDLLARYPQR